MSGCGVVQHPGMCLGIHNFHRYWQNILKYVQALEFQSHMELYRYDAKFTYVKTPRQNQVFNTR
jgi:hypothetical protein